MQEFLTNNTVNCNLMSLTGYRTLVILEALMDSPKSNDEINVCLLNEQYVKERFSSDTLRIYINSLRAVGCEIIGANKSNDKKYELISHPFIYDIPKSQLNALAKLYKNIYDKIDIREVIAIEKFFDKILSFVSSESTKDSLKGISILKNIDLNILHDLIIHCKNKNQISFLYNSPKSGKKEIEIIADRLSFKSEKLYLWGDNLTHKEYSYFPVERILKICSIKMLKDKEKLPSTKVIYELYNHNEDYVLRPNEKVIEKTDNKMVIECVYKSEFSVMQRILHMGADCKIIQPLTLKRKLLDKLKNMEKNYENS